MLNTGLAPASLMTHLGLCPGRQPSCREAGSQFRGESSHHVMVDIAPHEKVLGLFLHQLVALGVITEQQPVYHKVSFSCMSK